MKSRSPWFGKIQEGTTEEMRRIIRDRWTGIKNEGVRKTMRSLWRGRPLGVAEWGETLYVDIERSRSGCEIYITTPLTPAEVALRFPPLRDGDDFLWELFAQCHCVLIGSPSCGFEDFLVPRSLQSHIELCATKPELSILRASPDGFQGWEDLRNFHLEDWYIVFRDSAGYVIAMNSELEIGWYFHDFGRFIILPVGFGEMMEQLIHLLDMGVVLDMYTSMERLGISYATRPLRGCGG